MLSSRCARLANRQFHNGKGRPTQSSGTKRPFSQLLSSNRGTQIHRQPSLHVFQTAALTPALYASSPLLPLSRRFLSSETSAPASAPTPTIPYEGVTDAQWDALLQESQVAESAGAVGGYVGWLKDLGLDFGWGPTAIMQFAVEHLHVTGGMPWVAAIAAAVILIRGGAFPLYIRSADTAARMASLRPLTQGMQQQMMEARMTQDNAKMMQITKELRQAYSAAQVKPLRMIFPLLVQAPLGFGMFRLVRNMAQLPVPGMEVGGLLWFPDLTASDPYYILPVTASVLQWYSLKRGGETGITDPSQKTAMKIMTNVLPPMMFVIAATLPSGVQLLFFFAAFYGWLQGSAFRSPAFRRLVGILQLPTPEAAKPKVTAYVSPEDLAKQNTLKARVNATVDRAKNIMGERTRNKAADKRLSKAELDKAQEYEKARRAEIEAAREQFLQQQKARQQQRKR